MKRAPVIPKHTLNTQPVGDTSLSTPAAPMVDSLIARVGVMARGNAITLPVCGRDVKFTLEVLRGDSVEKTSRVWSGNERDQELLTEDSLDDLIPSFLLTGQQTPAFGRRVSGVIEIADGSRRRKAAALTESDYRVLVGELDDEQMAALSRLGNDIAQQVLMNVVSVMQADCRMNLLEIFLRWLMRKIFHVRLLPAVSTQPNCLNQLLLFFLTPVNYLPGQVMHFKKPLQIKRNYLSSRHLTFMSRKKLG